MVPGLCWESDEREVCLSEPLLAERCSVRFFTEEDVSGILLLLEKKCNSI